MTSEKSGSSREGTMDSSREGNLISGGGDREGIVSSEQRRLSTQRSLTTDTLEMSEDSFAMGDTSGDNPFQLEVTEYHQDPKLVNIHQFFPALEQNFTRAVSGRLGEERQALKAIAEEDGHSMVTNDESVWSREDGDSHSTRVDGPDGNTGNDMKKCHSTRVDGPDGNTGNDMKKISDAVTRKGHDMKKISDAVTRKQPAREDLHSY